MTSSEMSIDGSYTSVSEQVLPLVEEHQVHPDTHDQANLQDTAAATEGAATEEAAAEGYATEGAATVGAAMEGAANPPPERAASLDSSRVSGGRLSTMAAAPSSVRTNAYLEDARSEEFPMRPKRSWIFKIRRQIRKLCNWVAR